YFKSLYQVPFHDKAEIGTKDIGDVEWNPSGTRIGYSRMNNTLIIKEFRNQHSSQVLNTYIIDKPHANPIEEMSWHPFSDSTLITVGRDEYVKIWNTKTLKLIYQIKIKGNCYLVKYSNDGRFIMTTSSYYNEKIKSNEYYLSLVNVKRGYEVVRVHKLEQKIYDSIWTNSSNAIIFGCLDGSVPMYKVDEETGDIVKIFSFEGHMSTVNCLAFDTKGRYLVTGGHEGVIAIWSMKSLSCIKTLAMVDEPVMSLDLSREGSYCVATFQGNECGRVFHIDESEETFKIEKNRSTNNAFAKVRFHPKQSTFVYTTYDGVLTNLMKR
ncbi:Tex1p, partial [Ascoidea rubescens DSM 1968]